MRLKDNQIEAIKTSILTADPQAEIYLFGSRVDPQKKGGDIDLLVISQILEFTDKMKILSSICKQIGDQKIDLVFAKNTDDPFVELAYETGKRL